MESVTPRHRARPGAASRIILILLWLVAAWLIVGSTSSMIMLSRCAPQDQSSTCNWFSKSVANGIDGLALVVGIIIAAAASAWEFQRSRRLAEPVREGDPPT